jgi:AraC-like DNA-binding protein
MTMNGGSDRPFLYRSGCSGIGQLEPKREASTSDGFRVRSRTGSTPETGRFLPGSCRHTTFHVLSYGLCASSTLKDAFERLQRYCHVASDAVEYEFRKCGSDYHFVIEPAAGVPFESIDALVGAQLRMCRSLIGRDFSPRHIELRRPRPAVIDDFERMFRAPLLFGAAQNRLVFDGARIESPLDGAPHHSVSEIPYLLGFSSGSSFTGAFRRWTGQSPSNWRAGAAAP